MIPTQAPIWPKRKFQTLGLILFFLTADLHANNVLLSGLGLESDSLVVLTVRWENAWDLPDPPGNHDAVWIFLKALVNGVWVHIDLSSDLWDYPNPTGSLVQIVPVSDSKGVFIKSAQQGGFANLEATLSIRLKNPLPMGTTELQAFGIEMVYIPQGGFLLGDQASINSFANGPSNAPLEITSENPLACGPDGLHVGNPNLAGDVYAPQGQVPASYPKGFRGFYVMKYEISQEQFADFLNSLTPQAQVSRFVSSLEAGSGTPVLTQGNVFRNGLVIQTPGLPGYLSARVGVDGNGNMVCGESDDGQCRAANFLNWADLAAYLDWSALRPLSESEFEKICRGTGQESVEGEMAWGTPFSVDANVLLFDGLDDETVSDTLPAGFGLANQGYAGIQGPLRCGFAAGSREGRVQTGAAYYGVMEMSGNLWEMVVSLCPAGMVYTGHCGDGNLSPAGQADVPGWPDPDTAEGTGFRGGAWNSGVMEVGSFRDLAISDRFYACLAAQARRNTSGGRGAR